MLVLHTRLDMTLTAAVSAKAVGAYVKSQLQLLRSGVEPGNLVNNPTTAGAGSAGAGRQNAGRQRQNHSQNQERYFLPDSEQMFRNDWLQSGSQSGSQTGDGSDHSRHEESGNYNVFFEHSRYRDIGEDIGEDIGDSERLGAKGQRGYEEEQENNEGMMTNEYDYNLQYGEQNISGYEDFEYVYTDNDDLDKLDGEVDGEGVEDGANFYPYNSGPYSSSKQGFGAEVADDGPGLVITGIGLGTSSDRSMWIGSTEEFFINDSVDIDGNTHEFMLCILLSLTGAT